MGDIKKMAALEAAIRHACSEHRVEEIGSVLSAVLIDFAKHVGMPRDVFVSMICDFWDEFDDHENQAEVEVH